MCGAPGADGGGDEDEDDEEEDCSALPCGEDADVEDPWRAGKSIHVSRTAFSPCAAAAVGFRPYKDTFKMSP